MSNPTRVIAMRDAPPGWQRDRQFVYIGRAGHGLDGYYGNPFRLGPGESRGATIERYRAWLWQRIQADPQFARDVATLYGRTLVCFCKPAACHGDVLARAAAWLDCQDHCDPNTPCIHKETPR